MSLESNFMPHREAAGAEAQAPGYHLFSILHPSECIFGPDAVASWDKKAARLPASHRFASGAWKGHGLCLHQESGISPATPGQLPLPPHGPELCLANISARVTTHFVTWWAPAQKGLFWVLFHRTMYVFPRQHTLPIAVTLSCGLIPSRTCLRPRSLGEIMVPPAHQVFQIHHEVLLFLSDSDGNGANLGINLVNNHIIECLQHSHWTCSNSVSELLVLHLWLLFHK